MDLEPRVIITEQGIITDIKEGVELLKSEADSVFLAAVILVAVLGLYIRSPYRSRKLEEIKRLQETNTQLAQNNRDTITQVGINTRTIDQIVNRMDQLHDRISQLGEDNEEVLREIREVKSELRGIQAQMSYRKGWK